MSYVVDGKVLSLEEFVALQNNPNVRLILVEDNTNTYKTLQKLHG